MSSARCWTNLDGDQLSVSSITGNRERTVDGALRMLEMEIFLRPAGGMEMEAW